MAYTKSDGPFLIKENDSSIRTPSLKRKLSQVPDLLRESSLLSSRELAQGSFELEVFSSSGRAAYENISSVIPL